MAAPGPSLERSDLDKIRGRAAVLVVNDAYRLAPWADALYAADGDWWNYHYDSMGFDGELWTQDKRAADRFGLNLIPSIAKSGFSLQPTLIHQGSNSGYQAVNLALLLGANPIILLGFDMRVVNQRRHFFGDHPGKLNKPSPYHQFIAAFRTTTKDLGIAGVRVINCTPASALDAYPMMPLQEALRCLSVTN